MAQRELLCPPYPHCISGSPASALLTSLLVINVMETSSLTVVVATLGPGGSNSELPNFFQFWAHRRVGRSYEQRKAELHSVPQTDNHIRASNPVITVTIPTS